MERIGNGLRRIGCYGLWLKYAAIFCFAGFILLLIVKVSFDVTILFKLFFPLELISMILRLILYRTLPVNESEVV